jgi:hypothetical protein
MKGSSAGVVCTPSGGEEMPGMCPQLIAGEQAPASGTGRGPLNLSGCKGMRASRDVPQPPSTNTLFPLPLVEVPRPSASRSRRAQQRARRSVASAELANSAIQALNRLHCSLSPSYSTQTRNPSYILSKLTLRSLAHIQLCADRFVSRLAPSFKDASSDDMLCVSRDPADLAMAAYAFPTTETLPLSAERVALPTDPGGVDLVDILPPDLAAAYATPNPALFRPEAERVRAPHACLVRSPRDYNLIIRRMHDLGMVVFTTCPQVVNGCFGTRKSDGSQRFVFDGRPANAVFVESPTIELPAPDLLSRLLAVSDEPIYVAKADLDNYYHRIRLPAWLHPYLALPPVRAGDVGQESTFGSRDILIYPCCTTLPMGWSHAAFLAQKGHVRSVSVHTSLAPADLITRASDLRLDRPRHAIYIDDLVQIGPQSCLASMSRKQLEYITVMNSLGLPPKPTKTVLPSADGVECIGVEIHGRLFTAGVAPAKINRLMCATRSLMAGGSCSGWQMSVFVGHWSWVLLCRRPGFAVFSSVYRYIEAAGAKVFTIWPSVRMELTTAIGRRTGRVGGAAAADLRSGLSVQRRLRP